MYMYIHVYMDIYVHIYRCIYLRIHICMHSSGEFSGCITTIMYIAFYISMIGFCKDYVVKSWVIKSNHAITYDQVCYNHA